MPNVVTQADLFAHLREHCIEGVEDPFERIRSCMDGVREDLASAADDVGSYRSRTAASDVEDAAMLMGEAVGFALGYKIPAGEGHPLCAVSLRRSAAGWSWRRSFRKAGSQSRAPARSPRAVTPSQIGRHSSRNRAP